MANGVNLYYNRVSFYHECSYFVSNETHQVLIHIITHIHPINIHYHAHAHTYHTHKYKYIFITDSITELNDL